MPLNDKRKEELRCTRIDALYEVFVSGFRRSKRGNLWRLYDGATVSVFSRDDGFFGWCVAGGEEKRYSRSGYETEEEAMSALVFELGDADL